MTSIKPPSTPERVAESAPAAALHTGTSDLRTLPFRHIRRPIYPLDDLDDLA